MMKQNIKGINQFISTQHNNTTFVINIFSKKPSSKDRNLYTSTPNCEEKTEHLEKHHDDFAKVWVEVCDFGGRPTALGW